MISETFSFETPDREKIFVYKWLPDNEIKAVVQIAHGMAEHARRYEEFAKFLTDNSIAVYANDHRGHGNTAGDLDKLGYFADKNGWELVLKDMNRLTHIIKQEHPDKPIFLLGHSMGSLFARAYMVKYPNEISGVILSGTSGEGGLLVSLGKTIAKLQGTFTHPKKQSQLLNDMTFKDYNKAFKPAKTDFDWLSRDEKVVQDYINDPYCGQVVSNRFYYDMLSLIQFINKDSSYTNAPKDMPVLMFSGENDPVGNFGKGVKKVYNKYKKAGVKDITLKLYPEGRHEMLNETNRSEVYNDVLQWINSKI